MKNINIILAIVFFMSSVTHANSQEGISLVSEIEAQLNEPEILVAANTDSKKPTKRRRRTKRVNLLTKAKRLAVAKKYEESSQLLFSLTRSSKYKKDKSQIKYILGLMLMEMGLYQVASFVFYDVISSEISSGRTSRYLRQSLGKLSFLSNALDSDVLLKYTISKN